MKTLLKLTTLAGLLAWALPAHAGGYYDLTMNASSATLRVGNLGSNRNDAVFTSSGAVVVQSTSATAGYKPWRLLNNAGSEIASFTQNAILTVASFVGNLTGNVTGNVTGNASTATALAANGSNCSAASFPLGVDASGAAESCTTLASSNAGTATALAANGTNAASGFLCLGVDASGNCEAAHVATSGASSSTEPVTSGALFTHAALTGTSAHGATTTNTASQLVARDGSGNFAAGTITAALSGNATTASALAANGTNCGAGNYPLGVDASGNAESCTAASGAPKFLQIVSSQTAAYMSGSATIPFDDTIPQITEGWIVLTATITATNASSNLNISANLYGGEVSDTGDEIALCVFKDTGVNAIACVGGTVATNTAGNETFTIAFSTPAVDTSAHVFTLKFGENVGSTEVNGKGGSRKLGGSGVTSMKIEETAP